MKNKKATIADLRMHIQDCIKTGAPYDWLTYTHTHALSNEIAPMFIISKNFNWVHVSHDVWNIEREEERKWRDAHA